MKLDHVNAFDTLLTMNHLQILKNLLPAFPKNLQGDISIYIKYRELQYTYEYFYNNHVPLFAREENLTPTHLCESLTPYCTEEERHKINHIANLFSQIDNLKEIMEMMDLMKDMFPEGMGSSSSENTPFDFSSIMPDYLSEIINLFQSK